MFEIVQKFFCRLIQGSSLHTISYFYYYRCNTNKKEEHPHTPDTGQIRIRKYFDDAELIMKLLKIMDMQGPNPQTG